MSGSYIQVLVGILLTGVAGGISVEESCLNGADGGFCLSREACDGKVELENILDKEIGEDNIFLIETSEKEVISPREACALESAARNSGLSVVMVRVGKVLDKSDNTTCQVLDRFHGDISIYHIDPAQFSVGSPIEGFFTSQKLKESMNKYVHSADALRLLLVERYGGFYADLDFVIIKSLKGLKNVIASDQVTKEEYDDNNHLKIGDTVTNAIFHFSKGATILQLALENFNNVFQSNVWASGGPDLLHRCLLFICGFSADTPHRSVHMTRERFSPDQCSGVSVLENRSFFPFGWMRQSELWEPKRKRTDWYDLLQNSYAVHFYHSSSQSVGSPKPINKPKYYGARKPAYLVLAMDHCPVAYWSKAIF